MLVVILFYHTELLNLIYAAKLQKNNTQKLNVRRKKPIFAI